MKSIRLLLLLLIAGTLLNTNTLNAQAPNTETSKKIPDCPDQYAYGRYCFTNEYDSAVVVALCTSPTYKSCQGQYNNWFPLEKGETSCFYDLFANPLGSSIHIFVFKEVEKFKKMSGSGVWENLVPHKIKPVLIERCTEKHMVLKP